jgi:hypothetical protein
MKHAQLAARLWCSRCVVVQRNVQPKLGGTLLQQRLVGDHYERMFMPCQLQTKIGTYSGGLA